MFSMGEIYSLEVIALKRHMVYSSHVPNPKNQISNNNQSSMFKLASSVPDARFVVGASDMMLPCIRACPYYNRFCCRRECFLSAPGRYQRLTPNSGKKSPSQGAFYTAMHCRRLNHNTPGNACLSRKISAGLCGTTQRENALIPFLLSWKECLVMSGVRMESECFMRFIAYNTD
jgi:hypothetical protein